MNQNTCTRRSLAELPSDALLGRLPKILGNERGCLVEFLWHLAEVDRRKLHLELGYPSLFTYCLKGLRLSKSSSGRRATAARLLMAYPAAEPYLLERRLSLSTFTPLHEVLTPENHVELLALAADRTKEEVELLVATLNPRPDVKPSLRRQPIRRVDSPPAVPAGSAAGPTEAASAGLSSPPGAGLDRSSAAPRERRPRIAPINGQRYSMKLSVSREFVEDLERVKSALSHIVPNGDLETVLHMCLQKTLEVQGKRKHGALSPPSRNAAGEPRAPATSPAAGPTAPSPAAGPANRAAESDPSAEEAFLRACWSNSSRHIPAWMKRVVWKRDQGMCAWVGTTGHRCCSTHQLEFDHIIARALGGETTVENLRLTCKSHNQYAAALQFGEAHMARFRRSG